MTFNEEAESVGLAASVDEQEGSHSSQDSPKASEIHLKALTRTSSEPPGEGEQSRERENNQEPEFSGKWMESLGLG